MSATGLRGLMRLAAAVALVVGPARVWADPLPAGGDVTPSIVNTTGVSGGATILADTGWLSSATVEGTGQMREVVVSGDANNPYGGLDFIYQLHNTSPSNSGINLAAFNAFHYGSFLTDVLAANPGGPSFTSGSNSFATPGPGGNDPTGAERSNNGGGTGNQVSFLFGLPGNGNLTPGSYSDLLIVRTNAPAFAKGIFDFNDGGTSGHLSGFQPAAGPNVPEPSTLVLLGGYLAVLGAGVAWKRRHKLFSDAFVEALPGYDASAKRR
jgi:hypothetical protein